jgi:hypothetical protein
MCQFFPHQMWQETTLGERFSTSKGTAQIFGFLREVLWGKFAGSINRE